MVRQRSLLQSDADGSDIPPPGTSPFISELTPCGTGTNPSEDGATTDLPSTDCAPGGSTVYYEYNPDNTIEAPPLDGGVPIPPGTPVTNVPRSSARNETILISSIGIVVVVIILGLVLWQYVAMRRRRA